MSKKKETKEDIINRVIQSQKVDTDLISDGCHTFGELYDHRIALFIALCLQTQWLGKNSVWCSKLHHDGTSYEGWFIAGINKEPGKQISYHLPIKEWEFVSDIAEVLDCAPKWDGHTPADVLERLKKI